jgi:hypothetical protein
MMALVILRVLVKRRLSSPRWENRLSKLSP